MLLTANSSSCHTHTHTTCTTCTTKTQWSAKARVKRKKKYLFAIVKIKNFAEKKLLAFLTSINSLRVKVALHICGSLGYIHKGFCTHLHYQMFALALWHIGKKKLNNNKKVYNAITWHMLHTKQPSRHMA